jgi:DNA polymerase
MDISTETEILKELKKALKFYREIGFQHLPIRDEKIHDFLIKVLSKEKDQKSIQSHYSVNADISSSKKQDALKKLFEELGDCQRCGLSKGRKNIVFGEGNPAAQLMFIGEGPGREEDLQGRPFVGDAGQVLTNLIKKMGLKRKDVYIANIVKCRPPNNRDPEEEEKATCSPFLEKQIEIIKPIIIVALGRIAAHTLTGSTIPITKMRGNFFKYKDIPVMPTFHPAYLIRNPKDKWLTWEDAQKVIERLK